MKFHTITMAALLTATSAYAGDDAPAKLDRPAEIVIIGDGEMTDALERALEDEVAVINEEGGVLGWPLKMTRDPCETGTGEQPVVRAKRIAEREPLLVFHDHCPNDAMKSMSTFASTNILFMAVGNWPGTLTVNRESPTVFRLSPRYDRAAQEIAFWLASADENEIGLLPDDNPAYMSAIKKELAEGFSETTNWGTLLHHPRKQLISAPQLLDTLGKEVSPLLLMIGAIESNSLTLGDFVEAGWRGRVIISPVDSTGQPTHKGTPPANPKLSFPGDVVIEEVAPQPFYLGAPPPVAKAYTAFHPDWVAGFWQVMKAVKYAQSLDGREIAKDLGGPPFFSRAPWLMLQSGSRYQPPELRQRFNDNGDLRMAGYKLEKIWPKE